MRIQLDFKQFNEGMKRLDKHFMNVLEEVMQMEADEMLRISVLEAPLDEGTLINSGSATIAYDAKTRTPVGITGFNTPYAVKLHEHPEFRFQNNRKGKYLEDPLKKNINTWNKIASNLVMKKI